MNNNEEIIRDTRFIERDKVLVKNIRVGEKSAGVNFADEMQRMIGKVYEIYRVEHSMYGIRYVISNEGLWRFGEEWLEPANIQEEEKKEEVVAEEKEIVLKYEATEEDIQEMISKVDINTFLQIIRTRIYWESSTKDITIEHVMPILRNWAKSKFRFYKLFNKKLSISRMVEIEKDEGYVRDLINEIKTEFPLYTPIIGNVYIPDILNNSLSDSSNCNFFEDKKVKIGMKFTRFMALYGNKDLNMAISKLYQDKAKKTVYISIDPCDYLTTSINKSWRSCHNFIDGEWRNAGLALMQDNTSLIAYSCSDKMFNYSYNGMKFSWNNKTWRQMVYVSETNSQMIFSLQYPYKSEQMTRAVREMMEERMTKKLRLVDKWSVRNSKENIRVITSKYMYNDVGRSGCKFVINKFDKNKTCTIETGKDYMTHLNDDMEIEGGDYRIWD